VNSALHTLLSLSGAAAYALVGALCFAEAGLFVGFFIPGETAVVLGGVLASEHRVNLIGMCAVAVGCAIAGDSLGYAIGRLAGPFLLQHKPLKGRRGVDRTRDLICRRGAIGVFLGRFAAVFRALVPGVAGLSAMPYRKFLIANASGGLIWGIAYTLAGYAVGKAYDKILTYGSIVSGSVIGVAVLALVIFLVLRRRRERRKEAEQVA
jgi:membrane-associated protein